MIWRRFCFVLLHLAVLDHVLASDAALERVVIRVETDVSRTTNLIHWIDNLAGTSIGKTTSIYRRYWQERFGPMTAEDRRALTTFASIRRMRVPVDVGLVNSSGCLPQESSAPRWHQIFMIAAMQADSLEDFAELLSAHLDPDDTDRLIASLQHFRPRFDRVWRDLGHLRRFEKRFSRFMKKGELPGYLEQLGRFFRPGGKDRPAMKISFIGLPVDGPTHAEADGDHLLVEIRPRDTPPRQIQVVSHEAAHFLMRRIPVDRLDDLARQAYASGPAGALAWRYIWEGIPTALGQGLAEATLVPSEFAMSATWYHVPEIDRFAKMIYPVVADAVRSGSTINDGLMGRIAHAVEVSPMYAEASAAGFLMIAFYASGDGLGNAMGELRRRLGVHHEVMSSAFSLEDPRGAELLQRYTCLGGVALISPSELDRAVSLDGGAMLPEETLEEVRLRTGQGMGVIAAGRRRDGGVVYYIVTPDRRTLGPLMSAFSRLRGVPSEPIIVTGAPPARP